MAITKTFFRGYKSKLLATRWGYDVYYQRYTEKLWRFIKTNGVKRSTYYVFDLSEKHQIECELKCRDKKYIIITLNYKDLMIKKPTW
jgi:hypothetical protein